jgi:hypothetical protein
LQQEQKSMKTHYDTRFDFLIIVVGRVLLFVLRAFLFFPQPLQDLVVQISITLIGGSIILCFSTMYAHSFLLLIVTVIGVIVTVPFILLTCSRKPSLSSEAPVLGELPDFDQTQPRAEIILTSPHRFLTSRDVESDCVPPEASEDEADEESINFPEEAFKDSDSDSDEDSDDNSDSLSSMSPISCTSSDHNEWRGVPSIEFWNLWPSSSSGDSDQKSSKGENEDSKV